MLILMSVHNFNVSTVFERNFAAEIARMGLELEYQTTAQEPPQDPQLRSPVRVNGAFDSISSTTNGHQRNLSSGTMESSNAHLPFPLPSIGKMEPSAALSSVGTLANDKNPLQLSVASNPSQILEGTLRSPRSKLSIRGDRPHVNFALPNSSKDNGRISPAPSSVPSTVANGTLSSERPTSFLSRLSSIRKKRF